MSADDQPDSIGRKIVQAFSIGILILLGGGFALVFLSEFAFWWLAATRDAWWLGFLPTAILLAIAALLPRLRPMLLGALLGIVLLAGNLAIRVEVAPLPRAALTVLALLAAGALVHVKAAPEERGPRRLARYAIGLVVGAVGAALVFALGAMVMFTTL